MFCLRHVRWLADFLRWQDRGEMRVGEIPRLCSTVSGKVHWESLKVFFMLRSLEELELS